MANDFFIRLCYGVVSGAGYDTEALGKNGVIEKFYELTENKPNINEVIEKNSAMNKLIDTLNNVKKIKLKELVEMIKNFKPVEFVINDKTILAAFDKYAAEKNIYTRGNSTHKGFLFKLNNIKELPNFIKDAKYDYSKLEKGKESRQHKGVKEWHYFKKDIQVGEEKYDVVINIRDKGDKQYIYEIIFK